MSWLRDHEGIFTRLFRQAQSSTRGCPAGRTAFSTSGPFLIPNKSFPMSFTLWSICIWYDIASKNCFCTLSFLEEPSGALQSWNKARRNIRFGYTRLIQLWWEGKGQYKISSLFSERRVRRWVERKFKIIFHLLLCQRSKLMAEQF